MMENASRNIHHFCVFMDKGGAVNYVIGFLYLIVVGISVERAAFFIRTRYRRPILLARIAECIGEVLEKKEQGTPVIKTGAASQPASLANCFFKHLDKPAPLLTEIIDREGSSFKADMERFLEALSFIGTLSPLLGLLGTITGLMAAFGRIEAIGSAVDISALAAGIWEAMITTATGLVVAIFAVSVGRVCESVAEKRTRDMSYIISVLTEELRPDCLAYENEKNEKSKTQSRNQGQPVAELTKHTRKQESA